MSNNKSWSQSSPGFIYYDTTPNVSNTSGNLDFIEFSNTGSPRGQFDPGNYSSPNNFRQRNAKYSENTRGNRGFNRSRSNFNNRSFNNSRHQNTRDSTNNSMNNSRYTPYDRPKFDKDDITQYVHCSMLEDPWTQLEKNLELTSQSDSDQEKNSVAALKCFDVEKDSGSQCESTDSQEEQISAESS